MMKNKFTIFLMLTALVLTSCGPKVENYTFDESLEKSEMWSVKVKGEDVYVHPTHQPHVASFGVEEKGVKVVIEHLAAKVENVAVRPLGKKYDYTVDGNKITLHLKPYDNICVEVNGDEWNPLFLFVNPLEEGRRPDPNAEGVRYYKAGKVYKEDITLNSGETLWIEGGAIVNGRIRTLNTENVTIGGCGYVKKFEPGFSRSNMAFVFDHSNHAKVSDITILNRDSWSCAFFVCKDVEIVGLKIVAPRSTNQYGHDNGGIDMLGCQDATLTHCFAYAHDDAFMIKSHKWHWSGEVKNVHFKDCIGWNVNAGNTFEMGYEMNCNVSDVSWTDIYSIHSGTRGVWRRGAVTIHQSAGGTVKNVTYNNVHIEDPKEYAFHFAILKTEYGIGDGVVWSPGKVENVTFNNVYVYHDAPEGSEMWGYSEENGFENITFNNLYFNGKKVTSFEEADFRRVENIKNVQFK